MFDPATAGIIVACILVFLLMTGTHIGVGLGISGFIGILITINERAAFAQVATVPFSTTNSFTLAVIPLFILMGSLATQAGLTTDLYRAAYNWLGKISGGLAMATTLASAAFGGLSTPLRRPLAQFKNCYNFFLEEIKKCITFFINVCLKFFVFF